MKHCVFAFACALLVVGSTSSSLWAQELTPLPEPIAPTQTLPALPEPIGAAPVANAPLKGIKNRVADEHEAVKASAELVLPRLLSHELTVTEAWEKKLLAAPHIEYLLGEYLHPWGGFSWTMDVELRRALAKQLINYWEQSAPDNLQAANLPNIKPQIRLWIADYLQSIGDERTVPLAESVLRTLKAQQNALDVKDVQITNRYEAMVFQAIERMAWLWRDKGDYVKSGQIWSSVAQHLPLELQASWTVPDSLVASARSYMRAGNTGKAKELYDKVSLLGHGWFTALAYFDQARSLMAKNEHKTARKILSQTVRGQGSREGQFILAVLLSQSYYQTGEFQRALEINREAQEQLTALSTQERETVSGVIGMARHIEAQANKWLREPIQPELREMIIATSKQNDRSLFRRFQVLIWNDEPLSVEVNSPLVQARILDSGGWEKTRLFSGETIKEVVVEVSPEAQRKVLEVILTLSLPTKKFQVPVVVTIG